MEGGRIAGAIAGVVAALALTTPLAAEARVAHGDGRMSRKDEREHEAPPPLLATLVQTHTDERVPLDLDAPADDRFATLLRDQVTGERHDVDPRLLGLLRTLADRHRGARFEIVSGFRSPKRNETMRKKGHHVASHSQHSLGHAVDFRIVPAGADKGLDPRAVEQEVRSLGWEGGVGTYPLASDWFVHCDVGRRRGWSG